MMGQTMLLEWSENEAVVAAGGKMEYPQDIWNEVVRLTSNRLSSERVEAIIEAAQLPITPFGADEVEAVWRNGCEYSNSKHLVLSSNALAECPWSMDCGVDNEA
jgi:hypothetical protein